MSNGRYDSDANKNLEFPVHELYMSKIFDSLNDEVIKLIVFVPYYYKLMYSAHEKFNECKNKLIKFSRQYKNTYVVDFMFDSDIINNDSNYWDVLHYRVHVAEKVAELMHNAFTNMDDVSNEVRYLK